ncbi:hypothetical protein GJAV_G00040940 [Gymnothorax javanicus]|nr:hypothetical protein GJAV_G00040940 [Gymnothorax javanicus]
MSFRIGTMWFSSPHCTVDRERFGRTDRWVPSLIHTHEFVASLPRLPSRAKAPENELKVLRNPSIHTGKKRRLTCGDNGFFNFQFSQQHRILYQLADKTACGPSRASRSVERFMILQTGSWASRDC